MIYKIDNLKVDTDLWEVKRGDNEIKLSYSEFQILLLFFRNKGKIVTDEQIVKAMNSNKNTKPNNSNVGRVYVSYLRKKIDKGFKNKLIHTIRLVGYKFQDKLN